MAIPRRPGRRPPQRGLPIVRKNTVRLPPDVAHRVRAGHPWVYREALGPRPFIVEPGTPIDVVDDEGEFVGRGLYDSDRGIALRIFTRRPDMQIDAELISLRVKSALELRARVIDSTKLGATRLVNAENDGLPGIVVDRYGEYLVVQLFRSRWKACARALRSARSPGEPIAIYEQRRYKSLGGEAPRQAAPISCAGTPATVELEVVEDDLKFVVTSPRRSRPGCSPICAKAAAPFASGRRDVAS